MKTYKSVIESILNLKWDSLTASDLRVLMVLSAYAAREFGESLRIAIALNPDNHGLQEMAKGELKTDNLRFDGYDEVGDHADFLWYFINKHELVKELPAEVFKVGEQYFQAVRGMCPCKRAMSIVSREQELPGIFARILQAKDWNLPELQAFRYYLERHIALDSGEGGHAEMLSSLPVDDRVAQFYKARLEIYRVIPKLFEK